MGIPAQGTDLLGKVCESIAGSSKAQQSPGVEGEICPSLTQKAAGLGWASRHQEQHEGKTEANRQTPLHPSK